MRALIDDPLERRLSIKSSVFLNVLTINCLWVLSASKEGFHLRVRLLKNPLTAVVIRNICSRSCS